MGKGKEYCVGLLLAVIIVVLNLELVMSSTSFYESQFEKNGAYDVFGKETVDKEREVLVRFIKNGESISSTLLNEKEKRHMEDVHELYKRMVFGAYGVVGILVVLLLRGKGNKKGVMVKAGVITIAGVIGILLLSMQFRESFILFHEVMFDNELWILNPETDNLLKLFPESFFKSFVKTIAGGSLGVGLLLLLSGIKDKKEQGWWNKRSE